MRVSSCIFRFLVLRFTVKFFFILDFVFSEEQRDRFRAFFTRGVREIYAFGWCDSLKMPKFNASVIKGQRNFCRFRLAERFLSANHRWTFPSTESLTDIIRKNEVTKSRAAPIGRKMMLESFRRFRTKCAGRARRRSETGGKVASRESGIMRE